MYKFIKPEFKILDKANTGNKLEFELQPLVQGFATTLGNSLRRVLLSVVPGSAIYAFKIANVEQEFQTLAGVRENVLEIALNIEKIILRAEPAVFEQTKILTLELEHHSKTAQPVTAAAIKLPAGVKIINPTQVIAHVVDPKTTFKVTFLARTDYGYAAFVENQKLLSTDEINRTSFVAINSQFSPVKQVFFQVKEARVGEILVLGIETNQAFSADECLVRASKILITHLEHLQQLTTDSFNFQFEELASKPAIEREILLQELDFSERTINALQNYQITKLSQLKTKTKKEILEIKNLGQKSLKEIEEKLEKDYNILLKDD